ncbi:phosphatase PAP2 family protein [Streptomyces sp. NPDC058442]|uniref:phosphatase PAP2 family protein n=1 Tax=Streptomyces sp. NPDC058442 TaxID=3346503 RepID=UPI00365D2097
MTTAALTSTLLKLAVVRPLPQLPDPVDHAVGYAFPSGHALTGMVGCGVLLVLLRPALCGAWRAVAWSVAAVTVIGVGFTRIALGVHWVSDVVAGWLLGLAVLATTAAAFRAISIRSRSRRTRGH